MNGEIKEIIEYFKDDIDYLEEELKYPNFKGRYITIRDKECEYLRKLLDYITNLQEKVNQYEKPDDLTLFYMWLDEKAKDKMKKLQEENKNLKNEQISKYQTLKELQEENERLTISLEAQEELTINEYNKNKKAIEYIGNGNLGIPRKTRDKFIKILKGENNE